MQSRSSFYSRWARNWLPAAGFRSPGSQQLAGLSVDRHSLDGGISIEHGFCERWVCVDREHHLVHCSLKLHHGDGFGDELGCLRADDVHAEDFAVLRVGDDLYEAVVAVDDGGLGVAGEGKLPDLDFVALLPGLGLSQSG